MSYRATARPAVLDTKSSPARLYRRALRMQADVRRTKRKQQEELSSFRIRQIFCKAKDDELCQLLRLANQQPNEPPAWLFKEIVERYAERTRLQQVQQVQQQDTRPALGDGELGDDDFGECDELPLEPCQAHGGLTDCAECRVVLAPDVVNRLPDWCPCRMYDNYPITTTFWCDKHGRVELQTGSPIRQEDWPPFRRAWCEAHRRIETVEDSVCF